MQLHPAPPLTEVVADQPGQLRELAGEMAARLEVARTLPVNSYLGERPDCGDHPFGFWCQLALPIVGFATLVTAIFTIGPVLWVMAAITLILVLVNVFLGADKRNQFDELRLRGQWAPAVWIALDEQAFARDQEDLPVGHFVFTQDSQLAKDPSRLVELGQWIRSGNVDSRDDVQEMQRRIQECDISAAPLPVSKAIAGNDRTWFHSMEFPPAYLPDGEPSQALFFVLAMPDPSKPWHVDLLQSACLWGEGGESLTRQFPLQKLEVVR